MASFQARSSDARTRVLSPNQTPLIHALTSRLIQRPCLYRPDEKTVRPLLLAKTSPNARSKEEGQSGLMLAVLTNLSVSIINLMLERGADQTLRDNEGRTIFTRDLHYELKCGCMTIATSSSRSCEHCHLLLGGRHAPWPAADQHSSRGQRCFPIHE